jgi:intein-encoded DNA endonuclease-like protein
MFWEKACNPFAGKVWLLLTPKIVRFVSFFGGKEIMRKKLSKSMSQLRLREVRLVNLLSRRLRKGTVEGRIVSENRREFVTERNCFETRDRELR